MPGACLLRRDARRYLRARLQAAADEHQPAGTTQLLRLAPRREPAGQVLPPAPGAGSCPRFVRRRIAARLPEICEALIERALAGDLQAAKLLWQMAELDQKPAKSKACNGGSKTSAGFARKALEEFRAR